jgi:hypothetical protein
MSNPSTPTNMYERTSVRYWLLFTAIGTFAAALIAFCGTNFFGTRDLREIAKAPNGELEWLRREYHLSDAQFAKIAALQSAYTPVCNEMCRRIMEANSKLDRLVSEKREVTPELEAAIREAGSVQEDCHKQMLAHIYRVSAQMNPVDAQNYLRLMKSRVIQAALSSDTAVRATTE